MMAAGVWLFAMFGALSVDVGLLVNERRDVQNAADKAALAGALQLRIDASDTGADALLAADEWAVRNGVTGDDDFSRTLVHADTCFPPGSASSPPLGVSVTVAREPASFLVGLLGLDLWEARATAIACAGRPSDMNGLMPFALSEDGTAEGTCFTPAREPILGERCDIVVDGGAGSMVGALALVNAGACASKSGHTGPTYISNITSGSNIFCSVGDTVNAYAGGSVGQIRTGIEARIAGEGLCDANAAVTLTNFNAGNSALNSVAIDLYPPGLNNSRDDFYEIWRYHGNPAQHPAESLAPYDCDPSTSGIQTSPRNVIMIVIRNFTQHDGSLTNSYEVRGFARMFLEGCTRNAIFYPDCDMPTGGGGGGGQRFTIHARYVEQAGLTNSGLGYETTYGDIEVFLKQ